MTFLHLVAIVVDDYDPAIRFFVDILGFELVEDEPSVTTDGRPKRWVVVRPPGAQTGVLLARADGEHQAAIVGNQHAGRVGSSCASTTSPRTTVAWLPAASCSSGPLVRSPTARSPCSWISPETAGTCSVLRSFRSGRTGVPKASHQH